jgi:hypothetical protein
MKAYFRFSRVSVFSLEQSCQITKTQIWVYFRGPWNGKCWYNFRTFGIFYDQFFAYIFYGPLVYLVVIWYFSSRFGIFYQEKIWQPWSVVLHRKTISYVKADGLTLSRSEHNLSLCKMRNVKLNEETVEAEKHSKVRERAHLKGQIIWHWRLSAKLGTNAFSRNLEPRWAFS